MFANYGLTALAAQCLEKTVLILFIAIECIEKKKSSAQDLWNIIDIDKSTLGTLVKILKKKGEIPQELQPDLDYAVDRRNYVMHNFFLNKINRFDNSLLKPSPQKISDELLPIRDLLDNVQTRVDLILADKVKQLEVSEGKLVQEVERLFVSNRNTHNTEGLE
jgi:hypothetical protein